MSSNVLIQGKYVGDRTLVKELKADISSELITISHEHSKVHEGNFFACGYYNQSVINNGVLEFLFQTPADSTVHTYMKVITGGDAEFTAFEGTTFSAAGTSCSIINHNRSSTKVPISVSSSTPTLITDGTQLWLEFIPGGSGGLTPGAVQMPGFEQVVLEKDTNYLFRIKNIAGTSEPLQFMISFYEIPA